MNLFKLKVINEPEERTYGIAVRFLGLDVAVILNGFLDMWYLFFIKAFGQGITGIYVQVLGLVLITGIKADILFGDTVE